MRRRLLGILAIAVAGTLVLAAGVRPDSGRAATTAQMTPDEQRLFQLINNYRASLKLPKLTVVPQLVAEAQWYSQDMATNDSFSHTHIDTQGRTIELRFHDFGYLWQRPLAQASSTGALSPDEAFQQYRDSPQHDAIMRDKRMHGLGVGTASAPDTNAKTFWVASFGPSADPVPPDPNAKKKTTASTKKKASSKKAKKARSARR